MAESVKEKTIIGLAWSAVDNIASQGITFVIGILLARILSPQEFGTLGIAMIFVGLFNQIVDCGFSNALIRKNDVTNADYNTAFIFNFGISIILYFLCVALSPAISSFFDNETLVEVLRWLSIVVVINAVGIVPKTRLIKKIDFKTQTKISLISSISSGVVGIIAACADCGVMSLVWQQITRQSLNTVLLWIFNKWRPAIEFSIDSFKYQFSYGIRLLLAGLIDFIFTESASIVIGKVHSPETLGQYSRAKQFSSIFSSNVSAVMQRVTFPVLAKFQGNKILLAAQYRKIVKCLMLICGFCMITLACTAESVILILVGEKWTEAILYLQIICFNDMLYPIKMVNLNAIQVTGRSDLVLRVTIIKRFLQAVPIALGIFNIYYMLYGLVIASFLGLFLNAFFASKCIPYPIFNQLKDLSIPFFSCLIPGLVMFLITFLNLNLYVQLVVQLLAGIVTFSILMKVIKIPEYLYVKEILYNILGKVKIKFSNKNEGE